MIFEFFEKTKLEKISLIFILLILFSFKESSLAEIQTLPHVLGKFQHYKVKKSDTLYSIARKFDIALDHIMLANNLKSMSAPVGKMLAVPTLWIPPASTGSGIILNLPERNIYFLKDNNVKSIYPVAVGNAAGWQTPVGDYKIISKTKNPVWLPPEWAGIEKPVLPGPHNPLGDRWMGLSIQGYGIHATNNPMSIGGVCTHGCIRMYPEDAHKLFNQIEIGDTAKIIYKTIKLGFSEQTGKFYLSVFPDIYYQGTNSLPRLKSKLKEFGLEKLVTISTLIKILKEAKGIPQAIIGTDIQIKINEKTVWLPLAPIKKDQNILVSSHLFELLGFEFDFSPETKMIQLKQNFHQLTMGLGQELASYDNEIISLDICPILLQDYIILPLKSLKYFGYKISYIPQNKTINISFEE